MKKKKKIIKKLKKDVKLFLNCKIKEEKSIKRLILM